MKALVDLAVAVEERETTTGVSEMVQRALEAHKATRQEAAFQDIAELVEKIETHKLTQRAEIRRLKAGLKKITNGLDTLDRCWAFAQKSNNFMPVLAFFNLVSPDDLANPEDFNKMTSVPPDFVVEPK